MKRVQGIAFALSIAAGGWACSAQSLSVPFGQIERDAQSQTQKIVALNDDAGNFSSDAASESSFVSRAPSLRSTVPFQTSNARYFFVNGLHLGTAMLDVALTGHCIANHSCGEANPLMPSSAGGQVGVNCALVGYVAWVSYRMMKHQSRVWWIAPAIGTTAHAVGAGTGIAHF
jgi:hypothetical protein